jgi:hypothetical protein
VTRKIKKSTAAAKAKKSEEAISDEPKAIGLFDHVKHIRNVKDPEYFDSLSDRDKKSWSNFMILKALAMDPKFIEFGAVLYRFFDIIPPNAMYKAVAGLTVSGWCPWIKSTKKSQPKSLLEFIANHFEISRSEAEGYLTTYLATEEGRETLTNMMSTYGHDEKEITKMFKATATKGGDEES